MQPIRVARTSTQANEWALVLIAAGISHAVAPDGNSWSVLVPADEFDRAHAVLAAYDRESADAAAPVTPATAETPAYPWMSGVTVGLLLLGAFAITGPPASGSRWFERGAAAAGLVVGDEPWRVVTALTLHSNAVHVLGNAVATAVLLPPLVQRLGVGAALCLALLTGALGNLLSALVHHPSHVAIGASTATFGAIGALSTLRLLPSVTAGMKGRRRWVVIVATVLLLAMLGTARDADVVAHTLGLAAGGALGLGGALLRQPPRAAIQWALAALTALLVAGAWGLALGGS